MFNEVKDQKSPFQIILYALLITFSNLYAADWMEVADFHGNAIDGHFGLSVAVDGDTAVIAAPYDSDKGSVTIYEQDQSGKWSEKTKLFGESSGDLFGWSVSIQGATAVIGAPHAGDVGSAYIYVRDEVGIWSKQTEIEGAVPGGIFGWSVSIYGERVVIGAPYDEDELGVAYIYKRNESGIWAYQDSIVGREEFWKNVGRNVSIYGQTLAIAGVSTWLEDCGSVNVFVQDQSEVWTYQDGWNCGENDVVLGKSLALEEDILVIGAPPRDPNVETGSGYIFTRNEKDDWILASEVRLENGQIFGVAVAVENSIVLISGSTAEEAVVLVYEPDDSGLWNEFSRIVGNYSDAFGSSVDISENSLLVGAALDDVEGVGENAGSAYIYASPETRYYCEGFAPPMVEFPVSFQGNHSIPLRAKLFDDNGSEVTDEELLHKPIVQQLWTPSEEADVIDVTEDALPSNQGDDGNEFYYTDSGYWQFILGTQDYRNFADGIYRFWMESSKPLEYVIEIDPDCVTEIQFKD